MNNRLFEAMDLIKGKLKPEYKKFLDALEYVNEDVSVLDCNDYSSYFCDNSDYGLEANLMEGFEEWIST